MGMGHVVNTGSQCLRKSLFARNTCHADIRYTHPSKPDNTGHYPHLHNSATTELLAF